MALAAARILGAEVAVLDRSSLVLAATGSPGEQESLRAGGDGILRHRLSAAGRETGELRLVTRADSPVDPGLLELVRAIFSLELDRARSGDWTGEEAAAGFVGAVLARELADPAEITARGSALGADFSHGAGAILARLRTNDSAAGEDACRRALSVGLPGLGRAGRGVLAEFGTDEGVSFIRAVVAVPDAEQLERAARALSGYLSGAAGEDMTLAVGFSRHVLNPGELFRSGREALLAVNVAEAEGVELLSFESTGSHRLLLSAMSEDPSELEWFYSDTVAPLVAYDRQYGTDLVATVVAFLGNDGSVAPTAEELFTHRHTVRYRLDRVNDVCGHDVRTTDGREQLGFGLKAMRVLGLGGRHG